MGRKQLQISYKSVSDKTMKSNTREINECVVGS